MATIITKNSSTASAVPAAGDLVKGELAVNVTDKKVYTKDNSAAVVKLVGSLGNQEASAVAITGGTINGTTIGATTTATGAFTTVSASGGFTGNLTGNVTGNVSGTAANVTGVVAIANGGTGLSALGTGVQSALGQAVTGSGSFVLSTSPSLTTPNLGTPSAAVLTNATGLPLTTGVTGTLGVANGGTGITAFGTGVATALGQNVTGSGGIVLASSPSLTTPNLGTPSAVTLTNATGLPLSTGVTGTLATTNGGTGLTSFTANGVVYASSTSALTTGSALTFNGTNTFTVIPATGTAYNRTESTQFSTWLQTGAGNANVFWEFSAGTPVRWVDTSAGELMRLTSTGLGIGATANLTAKLNFPSADSGEVINIYSNSVAAGRSGIGKYSGETRYYCGQGDIFTWVNGGPSGTERLRLDSSGNLGLGVTPSAWGFGKALQVGSSTNLWDDAGGTVYLTNNAYYNGSNWIYKNSNYASNYRQVSGAHIWNTAPSGTAGNAISFTQALTLTAAANLLLGGTSDPGGEKALYIANTSSVPGTPTGGGVLYVEGGALKYKGSSGTVTTIANA